MKLDPLESHEFHALRDRVKHARWQRDQLLQALQAVMPWATAAADTGFGRANNAAADIAAARAAIAAATDSGPWKVQSSPHYPDRFEAVNADNLHLVTGFNTRAEAQIFCDTRNAKATA